MNLELREIGMVEADSFVGLRVRRNGGKNTELIVGIKECLDGKFYFVLGLSGETTGKELLNSFEFVTTPQARMTCGGGPCGVLSEI